jgi:hypothetical protein
VRGVGRGKAGGVPGNRLLPRPRGGGGTKGQRVRQQVAHRYWPTQKHFFFYRNRRQCVILVTLDVVLS